MNSARSIQLSWSFSPPSQLPFNRLLNIFQIEAEHHFVFDPGNNSPCIDCISHVLPNGTVLQEVLFVPDDTRHIRFQIASVEEQYSPLVVDPRLNRLIRYFHEPCF